MQVLKGIWNEKNKFEGNLLIWKNFWSYRRLVFTAVVYPSLLRRQFNANELKQRTFLIYIEFDSCEVRRLTREAAKRRLFSQATGNSFLLKKKTGNACDEEGRAWYRGLGRGKRRRGCLPKPDLFEWPAHISPRITNAFVRGWERNFAWSKKLLESLSKFGRLRLQKQK